MEKINTSKLQSGTITPQRAAEIIGVSPRTLDNWRSAGRPPAYVKISRRKISYLQTDIENFIQQRRIEPVNN
jgi:hypothetical protein